MCRYYLCVAIISMCRYYLADKADQWQWQRQWQGHALNVAVVLADTALADTAGQWHALIGCCVYIIWPAPQTMEDVRQKLKAEWDLKDVLEMKLLDSKTEHFKVMEKMLQDNDTEKQQLVERFKETLASRDEVRMGIDQMRAYFGQNFAQQFVEVARVTEIIAVIKEATNKVNSGLDDANSAAREAQSVSPGCGVGVGHISHFELRVLAIDMWDAMCAMCNPQSFTAQYSSSQQQRTSAPNTTANIMGGGGGSASQKFP